MTTNTKTMKGKQGFASMDPARVREIASLGGEQVHINGTGHEWRTKEEARAAGRRGGLATAAKRKAAREAAETAALATLDE